MTLTSKLRSMSTFSRQGQLPSLPVPALNDTLDRYLKNASAVVHGAEFEKTREAVEEFRHSDLAKHLQSALEKRASEKRNWLEDWWYDVYTEVREPIIPYLSLASKSSYYKPLKGSQIGRAADIAHHWATFWERIRKETLPITFSRRVAWDMHQYHTLFNSNRTPALPKDIMDRYFKTEAEGSCASHITVLSRGNIWKVEMLRNGVIKSPDELYQTFEHIKKASVKKSHSILTLTSEHRDVWAKLRSSIINHSETNKKNVQTVEESMFSLTLTDDAVQKNEGKQICESLMGHSHNQWADKSVNLMVYADGGAVTQGEHSNVDAIVVLHLGDDAAPRVRHELWEPENVPFEPPELLEFDLSFIHLKAIEVAEENFQKLKTTFRANVIRFDGFGNDAFRDKKIYTDTIIQLALQLAYLKTHGSFAPIYETASTRKFYHGRTETIRGCTTDMVEFGKAVMANKDVSVQRKLFKAAYDAHNELMARCMEGEGIDRHLLGLRNTLKEFNKGCGPNYSMPRMFTDGAWKKTGGDGNFLLSTSFTGYMNEHGEGSYGFVCAMRADGYGAFYRIGATKILTVITDWVGTNSNIDIYGENLTWALSHLGNLLEIKPQTTTEPQAKL